MLVRHFLANYHYPAAKGRGRGQGEGVGKAAAKEAFENWKGLYDLSLCMMYGEYCTLCHTSGDAYPVNSFVPRTRMESVLDPEGLDGWHRVVEAHAWSCTSPLCLLSARCLSLI